MFRSYFPAVALQCWRRCFVRWRFTLVAAANAPPSGVTTAVGFITIANNGGREERLLSAAADFAESTEIHRPPGGYTLDHHSVVFLFDSAAVWQKSNRLLSRESWLGKTRRLLSGR